MRPHHWREPAYEVAYFRDHVDTVFAGDVVRRARWTDDLVEPPDCEYADVRIAFLAEHAARMPDPPPWLVVLPASAEREPRQVVDAAMEAWPYSPSYRGPGEAPAAYVLAGFHALCPPHPPCEPGPGMRDSLMEFLMDRSGPLGLLARESYDGADRLFRVLWSSPRSFADDILRERIRDEGGRHCLQLTDFLEAAAVSSGAGEHASLASERAMLLERLSPLRYFTEPAEYDRAALLAAGWRERYARAYEMHYRRVRDAVEAMLSETAHVVQLLPELDGLNASARPVGEDAARRLVEAVAELRALPARLDDRAARTGGIILGELPVTLSEARLAAAAVLAALDIHRRRRVSQQGLRTS